MLFHSIEKPHAGFVHVCCASTAVLHKGLRQAREHLAMDIQLYTRPNNICGVWVRVLPVFFLGTNNVLIWKFVLSIHPMLGQINR